MRTRDIKTIDVQAKEWFDKVNGNSYFSAVVTINYQLKNEVTINLPFQYGYGDFYREQAYHAIKDKLNCFKAIGQRVSHWQAFRQYNIIVRYNMQYNCLKKEL